MLSFRPSDISIFSLTTFFACIFILSFQIRAETNSFPENLQVPDWVQEKELTVPKEIPVKQVSNGIYYLLVDVQKKVVQSGKVNTYVNLAVKILNAEGLESFSQLDIDFDPSYQKAYFHKINVIRNGEIIDKFSNAEKKMLQREKDLETLIYDGTQTAHLILKDVQIGDVLNYSYSLEGQNPIYNDRYSTSRSFEWSIPVHHQRFKLLWQKEQPIYYKVLNANKELKLTVKDLPVGKSYEYEIIDGSPKYSQGEAPEWYNHWGFVQFSNSESWRNIIDWALPLYRHAYTDSSSELNKIIETIQVKHSKKEDQIISALQFVQSNIRYFGLEMGTNSHKPSKAMETLERKFGDCKDKTVLLINLLSKLGIQSYPALVNTKQGKSLKDSLPSINSFDHVITVAELNGKKLWLDPTRNYQSGPINKLFQKNYEYALVVNSSLNDIVKINPETAISYSQQHTIENFHIMDINDDLLLEVETRYLGLASEHIRQRLNSNSIEQTEKDYKKFYSEEIGEIISSEDLVVLDPYPDDGPVKIKEKYSIKNPWKQKEGNGEYGLFFNPYSIKSDLYLPKVSERTIPYKLIYPKNNLHEINISFEKNEWNFENEEKILKGKYFNYESIVSYSEEENVLRLSYSLKTLRDFVPADDIDTYTKEINQVYDLSAYEIFNKIERGRDTKPVEKGLTEDEELLLIFGSIILMLILLFVTIVKWRIESSHRPDFENSFMFPISLLKFSTMFIATFGFYAIYWSYRSWAQVKFKDKVSIMPFWRGFFCNLWLYPLGNRINQEGIRLGIGQLISTPALVFYGVSFFLIYIYQNMDSAGSFSLIIPALILIPFIKKVNNLNDTDSVAYKYNSKFRIQNWTTILLTSPFILWLLLVELHYFPLQKFVGEEEISNRNLLKIQNKQLFEENEKIILFFTEDFFTVDSNGVGLTKSRIFSYWENSEGTNSAFMALADIQEIELEEAESFSDYNYLKVTDKEGGWINMTLSEDKDSNTLFVTKLKSLVKEQKSKQEPINNE